MLNFQGAPTNPAPQPQLDINTQMSLQKFFQCIDAANQLQSQQEMQNLLVLLRLLQDESLVSINKATTSSRDTNIASDRGTTQKIVAQFRSIKDRNHELLIKVLNLREKMVHQMYMYKVRSPKTESELDQLSEKIRHLKIRVNNKYTQLKFLKLTRDGKRNVKKQEYVFTPLNKSLEDLKKGAELIEKESIRLREELNLVVKYLHGEQI